MSTHAGIATAGDVATLSAIEADELASLFRLLGDPARLRILYTLLDVGEQCVSDLASAVGSSDTSVSQALRLLRAASIVRHRRDGRHVMYRLDDEHMRLLLSMSREHLLHTREA